jgi:hypothetical protein
MPLGQYDFYLDAWADWQTTVALRDAQSGSLVPLSNAWMEIRNTNFILVLKLDAPSGRCLIAEDGCTIQLFISAADSVTYFAQGNYPGAVQAVGFWGIGRSYIYDLFAIYETSQLQGRLLRGFFNVDPNISQFVPAVAPSQWNQQPLTIGQRGSYE